MNKRLLYFSLLIAALLSLAACGDDDDGSASPTGTPEGTPRPTAPLNLPDDFPLNFPLYSDSSLEQSARFDNQVLAVFLAPAAIGEVSEFYRTELATDPWELISEDQNAPGDTITMSYRNESDDLRGTVTISEPSPGHGTEVNLRIVGLPSVSPLPTPVPSEVAPSDTVTPAETESE